MLHRLLLLPEALFPEALFPEALFPEAMSAISPWK
jgi:hypothetical protein